MQTAGAGAPSQGHSRCKGSVVEKWWGASVKGVEGHQELNTMHLVDLVEVLGFHLDSVLGTMGVCKQGKDEV